MLKPSKSPSKSLNNNNKKKRTNFNRASHLRCSGPNKKNSNNNWKPLNSQHTMQKLWRIMHWLPDVFVSWACLTVSSGCFWLTWLSVHHYTETGDVRLNANLFPASAGICRRPFCPFLRKLDWVPAVPLSQTHTHTHTHTHTQSRIFVCRLNTAARLCLMKHLACK